VAHSNSDRGRAFAAIARYYRELHRSLSVADGGPPYRLTPLGAWAVSRAPHVFWFFRQMGLERYDLFLDLGSGDGVVAVIGGLFTRSIGIEGDTVLCGLARRAARDLGLTQRVSFICGDYLTLPIHTADCLYLYPDKPLDNLEELLTNWRGALLIYGPHFPPRAFSPVFRLQRGRERMVLYHKILQGE
jgi:hypothetical protein